MKYGIQIQIAFIFAILIAIGFARLTRFGNIYHHTDKIRYQLFTLNSKDSARLPVTGQFAMRQGKFN
jgi:hypothetical protein